jgi:LPXTG-site transpeptidase (sortase) family protein
MPKWGGYRAVRGLALVMTAAVTLLAGELTAGAAAVPSLRQQARPVRAIRYEKNARGGAGAPKTGKPARAPNPWMVEIPSIRMAADLITLGGPSGPGTGGVLSLPVPPLAKAATEAGWYKFTAVPGQAGNAVIVGHVDTYIGPAVFYDLYQLRPGESVYVSSGGTRRRFDVTSVREMPKAEFPVNQVFGGTRKHLLWLITCGGDFDYKTGHYLDNIVVSATWVPAPTAPVTRELKARH